MSKLVSILIPVFNSENTISESIKSCLNQTYSNFELLILDNNSKDSSYSILQTFSDSRIRVIKSEKTTSIAEARNILLRESKGEYITWLDADDSMMNERIEKQVAYLDKNEKVDVLGTWMTTDSESIPFKNFPVFFKDIEESLWFKNCLAQPTIMSRNFYQAEQIFYNEGYTNSAEDYELWYRLSSNKRFANLPEYLCKYHFIEGKELEDKKLKNDFKAHIDMLWIEKWKAIPNSLSEADKLFFQNFLYSISPLSSDDMQILNRVFKSLSKADKGVAFKANLAYQKLRAWKHCNSSLKFKYWPYLTAFNYYPKIKELFLK
jgi:glycosyltransferase involved in cell wall biosynthesis